MIKKLPWLRKLKKTDPEVPLRLPIACGPISNGEGWWPDTPRKKLIRKLVNEKAEEISRREGVDRREFMASACGMATTLYMINMVNGCSDGKKNPVGALGGGGVGVGAGNGGGGVGAGMGGGGTGVSSAGTSGGGMGGGTTDGGFQIDAAAMQDSGMADMCLGNGGNELIVDMQTHFLAPDTNPTGASAVANFNQLFSYKRFPWMVHSSGCDPSMGTISTACYDRAEYVKQFFMGSDTTVGVLSGISYPVGANGTGQNGFAPLTNEEIAVAYTYLNGMFPGRMLSHCMVMPNDRLNVQLAMMDKNAGTYTNWKTYPPWSPNNNGGWWLDGMNDPNMVGPKMIQKGLDLKAPIFCIHKGFPLNNFSPLYTGPRDVGPAARMFPDAHLVIYHSAFEHGLAAGDSSEPTEAAPSDKTGKSTCGTMPIQRMGSKQPEGPYDEANPGMYPLDKGVNSLIKSLRDAGIGPNGTNLPGHTGPTTHVYAECGSVWPCLLTGRVDEAMHFWGKLLKHIGEDRILWGTDCLWFGSPQPIIQAFRCFEISTEFQMKYGYPALTPARKEKILGQNARILQNLRPGVAIKHCHSDYVGHAQLQMKRDLDEEWGIRRDMIQPVWGPRTRREFLRLRDNEHQEKVSISGRVPRLPSRA